ncbi:hypothetical protein [Paraflavitalea speifideaquila]|uniref:hypothetical protein n=1 Tax=Paraflavitalea speifideaquila TaxID=3076558 RepID=UPI0028F0BBB5|nr:hypothetical protein [Paraflavitalea speifideiaquila]
MKYLGGIAGVWLVGGWYTDMGLYKVSIRVLLNWRNLPGVMEAGGAGCLFWAGMLIQPVKLRGLAVMYEIWRAIV